MDLKLIKIDDIDLFIFDFDGVLTDDSVYLNQNGVEHVKCSRSDGLAFDVLRILEKPVYILSTEKNAVVSARSEKLQVPVICGVRNKEHSLKNLANKNGYNLSKILYVGNDINDFHAMSICGYSACPVDSHKTIKKYADIVLSTRGGMGVIRELLEDVFSLDFIDILYK
jgi:N-acylneuraminate cytidylyltransferase